MRHKYVDKIVDNFFDFCINDNKDVAMRFYIVLFFLCVSAFIGPVIANKAFGNAWELSGLSSGLRVDIVTPEAARQSHWKGERINHIRIPSTVEHLDEFFTWMGYALLPADRKVPPIFVKRFPPDYDAIHSAKKRKRLFIKIVLPLILRENDRLRHVRSQLTDLTQSRDLSAQQRSWLTHLKKRYKLDEDSSISDLLKKVDVIPPGLALAQAANESGWGASRFTMKGNAIYGQWTWSDQDRGIVPLERGEGERYKVKAFDNLSLSVRAYMLNLNRHNSYAEFRDIRKTLRRSGQDPDSYILAQGLTNYSIKREKYVEHIRQLLSQNNFTRYDDYTLESYIQLPDT